MPWRFRKSIKLGKHTRINLGKKGASITTGVKGFHVTEGHGKTRTTVGLPGTGISYTHVSNHQKKQPRKQRQQSQPRLTQPLPPQPMYLQPPMATYTCAFCHFVFQAPAGSMKPGMPCPHCGHT